MNRARGRDVQLRADREVTRASPIGACRRASSAPRGRTRRASFSGYVAACDCGWHGDRDYPPTDEGEEKAIAEWHERHMEPLLPSLARKAARRNVRRVVDAYEQESVDGLGENVSGHEKVTLYGHRQLTHLDEGRCFVLPSWPIHEAPVEHGGPRLAKAFRTQLSTGRGWVNR
jgi:hypothetical protein